MSKIGNGYGSEWHLMRLLGRHRSYFDQFVLGATVASEISWLDFPFSNRIPWFDKEFKGLEFIRNHNVLTSWKSFWPQTGNVPNWDAVGKIRIGGHENWLLVEAKSYIGESKSNCHSKPHGGLPTIIEAFEKTKQFLGTPLEADWIHEIYQYCNRLATLYFLHHQGISAHLLFVFFTGDTWPGKNCPDTPQGWRKEIEQRDATAQLPLKHPFKNLIHQLFLNVQGKGGVYSL